MNDDLRMNWSVRSIAAIFLGNVLYALTVKVFLLPANLVSGGATGIALAANHLTGVSVSGFLFLVNMSMLILGLIVLGKAFVATTLASTFLIPAALEVFDRLLGDFVLTDDILLCTLFAGLGVGVSLGIVIRTGASTGGMDIPPLILYKCFRVPVSVSLYAFDVCILLLQAPFQEAENILYGIVFVLLSAIALDKTMMIGTTQTEVKIMSGKSEEIREAILKQLDRGVTLLNAEGGYLHDKSQMIFSVISNRELFKLEKIVHGIDPASFMVVTRVSEVKGRGFSMDKRAL
ncbi:YitT family protein [uncultured Acetatifactor sp.]|uniref:YitT family protein n=1 Tax=uncultured Acetatifactor sp. TaxID=1671927 RepID=UPI0025D92B13|nr:YitT family protein [uncultured Acetatifactor sp.]MCI9573464.1 YitT family protein [Lachnospiraceae bacterium]MCI9650984.1 YitT family protein [Lachnospiraceae bacterium]